MSVGFACAGMSQALRRRWVLVGVLFGVAFLCKQFAILPLFAALAAAPGWRSSGSNPGPGGGVVALGVVPFYVVAPVDTVRAMTAVYVAGVILDQDPDHGGRAGHRREIEARDRPGRAARGGGGPGRCGPGGGAEVASCRRYRSSVSPLPAWPPGSSSRSRLLNYYFLAVAVFLLLLDFSRRRLPVWSVAWIVATRYGLTPIAPHAPSALTAALFLVAALVPIGAGTGPGTGGRPRPSMAAGPTAT